MRSSRCKPNDRIADVSRRGAKPGRHKDFMMDKTWTFDDTKLPSFPDCSAIFGVAAPGVPVAGCHAEFLLPVCHVEFPVAESPR